MKAAVVRAFGTPPVYADFEEPSPRPGEILVSVAAAAVSPLVQSLASGAHYGAGAVPPFVPGVDGVGRAPDGQRVFFGFPRAPFGSLAERTVVASDRTVPLPDGLDEVTASGAANPGMSCWIPLTRLAKVRKDEGVLINGATGIAGRMAVQVAKYLGAPTVVATGRHETKLQSLLELGADVLVPLGSPKEALRETVRRVARDANIGIVLDYLWGPSAETILEAFAGPRGPRGSSRVRFVQVGSMSQPTITLPSAILRSSGVEILGSGLGSSTDATLIAGIGEFLGAFQEARFRIALDVHPLSEVEQVWRDPPADKRLVLTVP